MLNISFILLLVGFGIDAEITRRQAEMDAVDPKVTFGTVDAGDAELPDGSGDGVDQRQKRGVRNEMFSMDKLTGENFEDALRAMLDEIEDAMGSSAKQFSIFTLLIVFSIMLI